MKFKNLKSYRALILVAVAGTSIAVSNCGSKSGSGSRETQPNFADRGSVFSPGRSSVEFFESCFNLPSGEVAEFVGWMAAAVNLDNLSKVCRGLNQAGFTDGVSTTKEPADIN
jgi:hypothetical protein